MSEHLVRRTLERDVLPYLISARHLRQQWFYRLHFLFGYTTDLVAALAAIGVGAPMLALVAGIGNPSSTQEPLPTLSGAITTLPPWLVYPAVGVVVAWVFLRVTFNREDGQKRAVLAKSCSRSLHALEASLVKVLNATNPMPGLTELLETKIRPAVDRSIQEDAWPWTPFAPGIDAQVAARLEEYCRKFRCDWGPSAPAGIRQSGKDDDQT